MVEFSQQRQLSDETEWYSLSFLMFLELDGNILFYDSIVSFKDYTICSLTDMAPVIVSI